MKYPLAIHILTKNNEKTIARTLASLDRLNARIFVIDIGSNDQTVAIAAQNSTVVKLSLNGDYSAVRNYFVKNSAEPWQMYLEPWETLAFGHDLIVAALQNPTAYMMPCVQGDLLTKQIRLWHKDTGMSFVNPVYESLSGPAMHLQAPILVGDGQRSHCLEMVRAWKSRQPLATAPYYYEACTLLGENQKSAFLSIADHYLFHEKSDAMASTMLRYYYAMVTPHSKTAMKHIITCLSRKPLMAEFWCVLGDLYYKQKLYRQAMSFYENAILLGSRRFQDDDWPMEISKYQEYPKKMMVACEQVKAYGVRKS